jgi:hypothetical protein
MNIELMEEIGNMTDKRCGRSIKWLCEELRKAIAEEMGQIDQWYKFGNYKQVQKIINRLRPAQYFCPELKQAIDSVQEEIINVNKNTGDKWNATTPITRNR